MSPIDPREIRRGKRTYQDVIQTDRLCGKCRYNLKGLPTDGKCPECGHPISGRGRGFRRFSDNLADAPLFYLKTLALGTWLLAISTLVMGVCFRMSSRTYDIKWAIGAGVAAVIWWVGVFIVTGQRAFGENTLRDEVLDGSAFRIINRCVHVSWIFAAAAWVVVSRAKPPIEDYAAMAAHILQGIGVLGLVSLAIQLASLSDWAGDTSISERFRVTAWVMGAAGLCVIAGAASSKLHLLISGLLGWAALIGLIALSFAQIVYIVTLIQFAGMAVWAIHNNRTAAETERRMLNKRNEFADQMADRTAVAIALQDAAPPPELGSQAPAQTQFESNVVKRPSGGANPYEVDPNQPS